MKRKIKRAFKFIFILAIFGIVYSFFFTLYENIKVDNMINDFKEKSVFSHEVEDSYLSEKYIKRYFVVPRETSYENDGLNVFYDEKKQNIGKPGDIFVTRQSPFPEIFGFHQFMSFYYGGHAALKVSEHSFIESVGFPDSGESILDIIFSNGKKGHGYSPTVSYASSNYWSTKSGAQFYYNRYYRTRYVGLRTKDYGANRTDLVDAAIEYANVKYENEALYNFLFFLDMRRKYYCTDFVSRTFEEAYSKVLENKEITSKGYAKRLNDDGFITSVNDLILSKDTYIHFYVEINKEKINNEEIIVENYYYLEDYEYAN